VKERDDTHVCELPKPVNSTASLIGHNLLDEKKDRPMSRKRFTSEEQSFVSNKKDAKEKTVF
jgi:hypothetical protein